MIDFEKEFEAFCINSNDNNTIKEIYNIIPYLDDDQMKVLHSLIYFIEKYDLKDLEKFVINYQSHMKKNKNMNFFSSMNFKNLLKAYTQEELIRGIKINSSHTNEQ